MLVLCRQIYYTSIQSTFELVFIKNHFELQVVNLKLREPELLVAKMLLLLLFLFVVVYLVL